MARKRKPGRPRNAEERWAEAKRLCRLSAEDLRKAKKLGFDPVQLIRNNPSPSQRWKLPVKLWIAELYEERFPGRTPADEEREEQERAARRRRDGLRDAARGVARELGALRWVERVLLLGSAPRERLTAGSAELPRDGGTAAPEHEGIALAVYLSRTSALRELQRARGKALHRLSKQKKIAIAPHQIDLFLLDSITGHYAGRLCHHRHCPAGEPECLVPGCGAALYLRQDEGFTFEPGEMLEGAKQLHPRKATAERAAPTPPEATPRCG